MPPRISSNCCSYFIISFAIIFKRFISFIIAEAALSDHPNDSILTFYKVVFGLNRCAIYDQ